MFSGMQHEADLKGLLVAWVPVILSPQSQYVGPWTPLVLYVNPIEGINLLM